MLKLYAYWRSSASYRVRSALNLKGLAYEIVPVHLVKDGGQQHGAEYKSLNPQELVPTLVDDGQTYNQSLVIFQVLEERYPRPALVPADPYARARMWAFCQYLACEVQPLQNLRVLQYLTGKLGVSEDAKNEWLRHWIVTGMNALEESLRSQPECAYTFGDAPTYADCCLVPQAYASERFGVELCEFPRLAAIIARLRELPAFQKAHPDQQPDAQK